MTSRSLLLLVLVVVAGVAGRQAYERGWLNALPGMGGEQGETTAAAGGGRQDGAASGRGRRGRGGDGPTPVLAAAARYEDVPVSIDAVGTIQALNTVTVRTQVDGRLLSLAFKDGQDVKRGDVLAHVDPATYQAQYDQAVAKKAQDEALLANARLDLDRYTKLAASSYGSQQQADTQKSLVAQYQAQVRADQGAIDNAKVQLDRTTITSPLEGRTGIRLVDAGNILRASDATGIVVVAQLEPIALVFNLPQQYLVAANAAMARGPVQVQALDSDNATVLATGTVAVIDNQVDATTGTVKIKANFANGDRRLWPGQFVNVRVFVDTISHAVVVPTAAVQRGPSGAYVYVLNDGDMVKLTSVVVGRQDETRTVVKSGLTPPARVVTTGFSRLTDGAQVSVTTPVDAPAPDTEPQKPGAAPAPADGDQSRRQRSYRQQSEATDSKR
jgi:multidrug efflux system membrane fusion protein